MISQLVDPARRSGLAAQPELQTADLPPSGIDRICRVACRFTCTHLPPLAPEEV